MARKRYNNRSRRSPGSERSYYEYLVSTPAQTVTRTEIVRLLRGGEDTYLELKVRFSNVEKLVAEIIALANTDGGAIVFGVNDQLRIEGVTDPEEIEVQLRDICANQIQPPVFPYINKVAFDSGRRIVVLEVDTGNRPHRTITDKFYIREGSTKREATREELSSIYKEAHPTRFEQVPVFHSNWKNDIDESLLWSYIRGVNPGYWGNSARGFPTDSVLQDMGLAVRIGDKVFPCVGGILLFGVDNRITELLPAANLTISRFSGGNDDSPVIEQIVINGNLMRLFDGAIGFIRRYADLWDSRPGRKTIEKSGVSSGDSFVRARANYHRDAITEALVNSLVHRDWGSGDHKAGINIYDDSIEFINPVRNFDLPVVSLRYGIVTPVNPRLKAVFTNKHYGIPATRGGIPMIFDEAIKFAKTAPAGPTIAGGEFRIKIFGMIRD